MSSSAAVDDDEKNDETKLSSPPPPKRRRGRQSATPKTSAASKKTAPKAPKKRAPASRNRSRAASTRAKKLAMAEADESEKSSACDDDNGASEEAFATIFDNMDNEDSSASSPLATTTTMDDDGEEESTTSTCVATTSSVDTAPLDCRPSVIDDKEASRPTRGNSFTEVSELTDCLSGTTSTHAASQQTFIIWESKQNARRLSKNAMEAIVFSACARTDAVALRCAPSKSTVIGFCPTFNPDTIAAFDVHCDRPRVVVINYKRTPLTVYTCSKMMTPAISVYSIEGERTGLRFKTYFYKPKVSRMPPLFVSANSYEMSCEILIQFIKEKFDNEKLSTGSQWSLLYNQANEIKRDDKRVNHFFVQ